MPRRRPELPPDTDLVEHLLAHPPEARPAALAMLGTDETDSFDRSWQSWAHSGQTPPASCPDGSDWRTWVLMAGRGFGKTLAGANWIVSQIATRERLSIALVAATLEEARRIMVEGRSGLLEVADAWVRDWNPSLRRILFTTGAEATLFSGASPEQLRGPEHHIAWCDELAKWEKPAETWDMLQLGLRLGDFPRVLVTTTPRPGPVLKTIMASRGCVRTGGRTHANPHLPPAFKETVEALYAGTRLGRQELDGELLADTPGALWSPELLERCRAQARDRGPIARQRVETASVGQPATRSGDRTDVTDSLRDGLPPFTRLILAIDPPSGAGTCGIIVCAKDAEGRAHVLADHSVTGRTPEGWSRAVADAARIWSDPTILSLSKDAGTATVVAESNQGGKMVESVLRTADPALKVRLVTATVGKAERAAPVAMLFEAGKVLLHGRFPELEAELLGMIAGGDYEGPGVSPDRADAMVWGLTELMLGKERAIPRVLQL